MRCISTGKGFLVKRIGELSISALFADFLSVLTQQFLRTNGLYQRKEIRESREMNSGSAIDYSVWDHIYVSDDEDVTSPYVDTSSLFRMRHRVSSETSSDVVWSLIFG